MLANKNKENCCMISNLEFCDGNSDETPSSEAVEVVQKTNMILSDDQILVLRDINGNGAEVYKAKLNNLDSEVALMIMERATQTMPRTDPANGRSLWLDEGFVRVASGDPSNFNSLSPTAMQKSLAEAFKILPTSDPGDGSPWLNGGVLMQGSNNNENCN
ncbi:hypothetical protein [Commensalibacter nepenthis]|uniref:Uncharacterized protein n=1 Tax=Commensalibacter nepenthis TaxID=3043872 RepID=A0ABT6Q5A4_9PROT|nr:hypothetical protein [Commensalibacter sp. TBRC 10068]MDI2112076.1 hypothetical protein [Commensalibacter sp. TBRC 10068]